jgi:hypothetical protein
MRYRTHWLAAAAASAALLLASTGSWAQVSIGISVRIAPPALPVYVQPPIPAAGYIWVPGYWAYDEDGYYWVPGTWVLPPRPGLLWTPGYWGWDDGVYLWHEGYWAPEVGFYGGVDYGFGYDGEGYYGGYWREGVFYYNSAVTRIPPGLRLPHLYRHPVEDRYRERERVSFNGGEHGTHARPSSSQLRIERGPRVMAVTAQRDQIQAASHERSLRDRFNHGRPQITGTSRPGEFQHPEAFRPNERAGGVSIPERSRAPTRGESAHGPEQRFTRPGLPGPAAQPPEPRSLNRPEQSFPPSRGRESSRGFQPQPQAPGRAPQGDSFRPRGFQPQGEPSRPHGGPPQQPPRGFEAAPHFTPQAHTGVPREMPPRAQPQNAAPQRQAPEHQAPERRNGREPPQGQR